MLKALCMSIYVSPNVFHRLQNHVFFVTPLMVHTICCGITLVESVFIVAKSCEPESFGVGVNLLGMISKSTGRCLMGIRPDFFRI